MSKKRKKNQLNKIMNQTFKYAKKIARDFYFNEWSKNLPKCPAFKVEGVKIKVVVRSIKNGPKHFYSVIRKGSIQKEIEDGQ